MKIIYTTAEDFIKQEIAEYGHDYVDRQFDLGYEPGLVSALGESFWTWMKVDNALQFSQTNHGDSHSVSGTVHFNRISMASPLGELVG